MDPADLDNRFAFHSAAGLEDVGRRHGHVRDGCRQLAADLDSLIGDDCREKSLAMTALEEAMMWSNAAIARHSAADRAHALIGAAGTSEKSSVELLQEQRAEEQRHEVEQRGLASRVDERPA